jgi:hypothetical protein
MTRIVSEPEFRSRLVEALAALPTDQIGSVTGPGRSGAIASVYASHLLGVPFIPFGSRCPVQLGRLLIIDTARESGATLRKTERRYAGAAPIVVACFEEPPRIAFWYGAGKPQRYRHEIRKAA